MRCQTVVCGIIVLPVLVAMVICCSDSPIGPTQKGFDLSLTPMEDGEAEAIAYFLSGDLVAPMWLYSKVNSELEVIRREWSDSLPQVNITYFPCLYPSYLFAGFDSTTMDSIRAGTYHAWDSLNEQPEPYLDSVRDDLGQTCT